jgi:hypothetical protein
MVRRCSLAILGACLFLPTILHADPPPTNGKQILDPPALAARIDHFIESQWTEKGVTPAPLADDAEFLRRVYLDLTGRIPRVSEARDFLADKSADRRTRLVETLLENPRYVLHLGNTWRALLLPANNNPQFQFLQPSFKAWLDKQVQDNAPYDAMVRELLTVPMNNPVMGRPQVFVQSVQTTLSPVAFYQANELKAENLASSTSRLFLGVRLECAQCHDHPFAKWTRKQFWEMAAFFSAMQPPQPRGLDAGRQPQPVRQPNRREIRIPGTDKVVEARFLDGKVPSWQDNIDSRVMLAEWLTSAENPYFAQTGANRVWGHFFGIGIVDPVDDEPAEDNPSSHPELLAELSRQFVAHQFDLKYLIRAITASKTYQRASAQSHESQKDPRTFARMAVKGMTPEQLFDSLAQATGYQEFAPQGNPRLVAFGGPNNPRAEFINRFASQEKKTETQTSILQALALMNGKFVADATSLERSQTLAAVADAPFLTHAQRIETLYLATLTRLPRAEEAARLAAYVQAGGPRNDPRAALADVFWALLNSSEFILNH